MTALAPDARVSAFNNLLPVNISFGIGTLDTLLDIIDREQAQTLVVVSDAIIIELPEVQSVLGAAKAAGRMVHVTLVPPGEPTIDSVDAIGGQFREIQPDLVIAIGGGSVLDSA